MSLNINFIDALNDYVDFPVKSRSNILKSPLAKFARASKNFGNRAGD